MVLSIIIINYNTFDLTKKCIESVIHFTQIKDYEIILVDNASTECDPSIFKNLFNDVILIKNDTNVGFAKGNNAGLNLAKGEYILLLNSDIELIENSIDICLNRIQSNDNIGVISPQLIFPDGKIQHTANKFPSINYEILELFRLQKFLGFKHLLGFHFDHKSEIEIDWTWGAFFMTKRIVIDQLPEKRLPDHFFMYFEDVEWCYLIRKMGFKILFTPDTKVIHHLAGSSKSINKIDKILPNETAFFMEKKGKTYTKALYYLRALKYFSLRHSHFIQIGKTYWQHAKKL